MAESFSLEIPYRGSLHKITCRLRMSAYTYQVLCNSGETEFILERDDEGNLRALEAAPFSGNHPKPDTELVRALVLEMERILHKE
jgi:hypothetical protein